MDQIRIPSARVPCVLGKEKARELTRNNNESCKPVERLPQSPIRKATGGQERRKGHFADKTKNGSKKKESKRKRAAENQKTILPGGVFAIPKELTLGVVIDLS